MTEITCETQGHLWNSTGKCVMCRTPRPIEQLSSKTRNDPEMVEWLWRWIDRMASGKLSVAECLSVLTHHPDAPEWVTKRSSDETPQQLSNPVDLSYEGQKDAWLDDLLAYLHYDDSTKSHPDWVSRAQSAEAEIERLRSLVQAEATLREGNYAEVKRLRAALVKHGTHAAGCSNASHVGECSCGLWSSLRGADETTPSPQAPIARVIVSEDAPAQVLLYAPGLPIGEHDLYCEPTERVKSISQELRERGFPRRDPLPNDDVLEKAAAVRAPEVCGCPYGQCRCDDGSENGSGGTP